MPVAALLAGAAQRHPLQDRHVVLDHRRLADHDPGPVVDQDPPPDPRRRMDVEPEHLRAARLQRQGEVPAPFRPVPVRRPMRLQRLVSLEEQEWGDVVGAGGVAVAHRHQIFGGRFQDRRLARDRVRDQAAQLVGVETVAGELDAEHRR